MNKNSGVKMRKELFDEAMELLIEYGEPSAEMQQKFVFCENGLKDRLKNYDASPHITKNDIDIIRIIACCMNDFLEDYPAPIHYKAGLRETFFEWFEEICWNGRVVEDDCNQIFNDIVSKYVDDPVIEVIKILHNQEGTTKEEISNILGVTEKTVQTILHKLENKNTPYKLGGIPVLIELDTFDEYSGKCIYKEGDKYQKRRHYLTKNTMHPLTYQMNLMQVGTLLYSLSKAYYEDEMYGAFYIALNTWCQLSEYAKERIEEVYVSKYKYMADFIDELCGMLHNGARKFTTESCLLKEDDDFSINEKLLVAHKGSLVCTLELTHPRRRLRNQRVFYDFERNQYYSTSADEIDSEINRVYLDIDDVFDLYEE